MKSFICVVAFILSISPVLANNIVDNPPCLLQIHSYIDLEEHPPSEQLELKGPMPMVRKNFFQRHAAQLTKSGAGSFTVHMLVWALNHMYVPLSNQDR